MNPLRPLLPLLLAAGILLAGNGLQGTLIALRGTAEGFAPATIGLIGAAYFAGFVVGCMVIVRMIAAVGHIRVFSALAAAAVAANLLLPHLVEPFTWALLRFVTGFCFAGLFTVMESWINTSVDNSYRGRVLSVYRIVDITAVTGSQLLIPLIGIEGFAIFSAMSIMISLSIVPVALADRSNPAPPEDVKLDLSGVWLISPLASFGSFAIGLSNSAFRLVGPIYGQDTGMTVAEIALFMSAGILAGAVMQYPLGSLSDRWDRRYVLILTSALAALTALVLAWAAGTSPTVRIGIVFIFGAFAMPIYSLLAAHANDRADTGAYVKVAAGLLFFYSIGAIIGPVLASALMQAMGAAMLFVYSAAIYAMLIAFTVIRIGSRPGVPRPARGRFVAMLRTSPLYVKLVNRGGRREADRDS